MKLPIQNLTKPVEAVRMKPASLALVLAFVSSCGMLGDKTPVDRILNVQNNVGCLDNLGPQFTNFADGAVSPYEWEETFKCLDNTLNTFTQFVAGNDPEGYSQGDIKALTEQFIITNKKISGPFIQSVFEIKSSLFGGKNHVLTKAQIGEVRKLLVAVKTSSLKLIPHLWNRKNRPTTENLREFMTAINTFGIELGNALNVDGNATLHRDTLAQFLDELSKISFEDKPGETPKDLRGWAEFISEIKVALIGGEQNGVGPQDWKPLFRLGTELGGIAAAYFTVNPSVPKPDHVDNPLFSIELAQKVRETIKKQIEMWGGAIPYSQLQRVAEKAPTNILPPRADDFRLGVKKILEPRIGSNGKPRTPAFSKLLTSGNDKGLNLVGFDRFVNLFIKGMRAEHHLLQIMPDGLQMLTPRDFNSAADAYAQGLSSADKQDVERLKLISGRHPGFHQPGDSEMLFTTRDKHSRTNLSKLNWYEAASERLLEAYGSKSTSLGKAGNTADLLELTEDLRPILDSLSMLHPDKKEVHKKRFREANLFTPTGNGNDVMDIVETSNYIAYLFSISKLSGRIKSDILRTDDRPNAPCPQVGWDEKVKLPTYDIKCFREHYAKNIDSYFDHIPVFGEDMKNYSAKERAHFFQMMEHASKFSGYNDDPISSYDVDSFSGVVHFVEETMNKFDRRGGVANGYLDRFEVMEYAWPIMKRELLEFLPIKWEYVGQKMLIYLMQKGKIPFKCMSKPTFGEVVSLLWWWLSGGSSEGFNAPRLRVVDILGALSMPPTPSCPAPKTSVKMAANGVMEEDLPEGWKPYEETLELLNQPE